MSTVTLALAGLLLVAGCSAGGGSPPLGAKPGAAGSRSGSGSPSPSPTPPAQGPYVALGDSYTAGIQIAPQVGTPRACLRSGVNYPSLVAKSLSLTGSDFRDVSCSGARTGDLTKTQLVSGESNPPQLGALASGTRLVTLGIGGNDAGFMDVIVRCAAENLKQAFNQKPAVGSACRDYYTSGNGADDVQKKVNSAGDQLGDVLAEIKQRSPQAKVYVVGYPELLPKDADSCGTTLSHTVSPGDVTFLTEKEQELNTMLKQRAPAAGAVYVDTYGPSAGHDMCQPEATRWVEPLQPTAGGAPIHPNAAGQRGMAAAVIKALQG